MFLQTSKWNTTLQNKPFTSMSNPSSNWHHMNTLTNQQQHTSLLHIKQAGLLDSGAHVPTVAEERKLSASLISITLRRSESLVVLKRSPTPGWGKEACATVHGSLRGECCSSVPPTASLPHDSWAKLVLESKLFMLSESEVSDSVLCWWQQRFIYLQKIYVKFYKTRITGNTG